MDEILNLLFYKLSEKGLIRLEIARLIRDAFNILGEDGDYSVGTINKRLHGIGWEEKIIDEHCLQLLAFLFENRERYKVMRLTVH